MIYFLMKGEISTLPRKKSQPGKPHFNFLLWLIAAFFASALIGVSFHVFIGNYMLNKHIPADTILYYLSLCLGLLFFVFFLMLIVQINRDCKKADGGSELNNFRAFTDLLNKAASDAEIYEGLLKFICRLKSVNHATLYYTNERHSIGDTWKKISSGISPVCSMQHRRCPVVKTGKDCIVQSINTDIRCACQFPECTDGSYVCLPVSDFNKVQSVLQVYSNNEYVFDNLALQTIKSYIDIAKSFLSNKLALSDLNKKATTDRLTKLYNRSFLEPFLESQIKASDLTGHPLSVIMVDIDYFKRINDTYGHAAGDHVLVLIAEVLVKCIRETDVASRFGGEEFVLVLPSANIETACSIAERIRQTTANLTIPPMDDIYIPKITCSLGVSVYPTLCNTMHELIKTADSALYKAKQSGRNCVKRYI